MQLQLQSTDVIHSFWVPEFGQKQDAVPGLLTKLVITPTRDGIFPVICTELCGLGHAIMRSKAIVMTQAAYNAWYKGESSAAAGGAAFHEPAGPHEAEQQRLTHGERRERPGVERGLAHRGGQRGRQVAARL